MTRVGWLPGVQRSSVFLMHIYQLTQAPSQRAGPSMLCISMCLLRTCMQLLRARLCHHHSFFFSLRTSRQIRQFERQHADNHPDLIMFDQTCISMQSIYCFDSGSEFATSANVMDVESLTCSLKAHFLAKRLVKRCDVQRKC